MLDRFGMLLVFCYFVYFCDYEVGMNRKRLYKVVNGFKAVGIIAGAIWAVINVVKELVSIHWSELAENGVGEYIIKFLQAAIVLPFCFFVFWTLHRLTNLMFHKMWPETFDENGHMRK